MRRVLLLSATRRYAKRVTYWERAREMQLDKLQKTQDFSFIYVMRVPVGSRRAQGRSDVIKVGQSASPSMRAQQLDKQYGRGHAVIETILVTPASFVDPIEMYSQRVLTKAGFQISTWGEYFHSISPYAAGDTVRFVNGLFKICWS